MLKIKESKVIYGQGIKRNIDSLVSVFSNFNNYSSDGKEKIINSNYVKGIVAVASNLDSMFEIYGDEMKRFRAVSRLIRASGEYDNFNPRYLSEFKTKVSDKLDVNSKVNQRLYDLEKRLGVEDSGIARFILLNALKYHAGKDVDKFELREVKRGDVGLDELLSVLHEDFDYFHALFQADMDKYCEVYAKDGCVRARFDRVGLEEYVLEKEFRENLRLFAKELEISYDRILNLRNEVKIKGNYSDKAVNNYFNKHNYGMFGEIFATKAFELCFRTKTDYEFKELNDYAFCGFDLKCGNFIVKGDVGEGFGYKSKINAGDMSFNERVGERFGSYGTINAGDMGFGKSVGWEFGEGGEIIVDGKSIYSVRELKNKNRSPKNPIIKYFYKLFRERFRKKSI